MRTLLLTGFLFISFLTKAQFITGDKVLGGTVSFFSQSAADSPNGGLTSELKNFSIAPTLSFLLNERWGIGGQIGYASGKQIIPTSQSSSLDFKSRSFSVGVFGQRYFKISDTFLFSLVGQLSFSQGFDTNASFEPFTGEVVYTKTRNQKWTPSIRPNFIFFPSPKWGFEASIGSISHTFSRNVSTEEKNNFFSFNYGTITFGIAYYFRNSVD